MARTRAGIVPWAGMLLSALLAGCYQLQTPDMRVYEPYFYQPAASPEPAGTPHLDVTFLGTTSLYFSDGESRILIDGFFTRPDNLWQVFLGQVSTDKDKVRRYLQRLGIDRLDAMPVFHSHYDHAMDTAEIARLTGARILGSESTAMIARGSGLPESQITVVEPGRAYAFGQFRITMIESKHVPLPSLIEATGMMDDIEKPLQQPASIYAYREGMTYAILIEHPLGNSLLHSGAFRPGELKGRRVDNLFLCTPGLPRMSAAEQEQFFREIITEPGVSRLIPVHWDEFTRSLDLPLVPLPRYAEDLDAAMAFLLEGAKADPRLQIQFLPAWGRMPLGKDPQN
ncbi:MAG: MBL fold metallo-hydrolase [Candidatus Sericytochromatia bacterium]